MEVLERSLREGGSCGDWMRKKEESFWGVGVKKSRMVVPLQARAVPSFWKMRVLTWSSQARPCQVFGHP